MNSKKAPSPWLRGFLGGCTAPPPPDHASDEIDELEIESGQASGQHSQQDKADEVAEGRRKRRLILNRWQLARVLLFNGSLIKYRKHNLTVSGIHQKELSELVEAMRQVTPTPLCHISQPPLPPSHRHLLSYPHPYLHFYPYRGSARIWRVWSSPSLTLSSCLVRL